MYSRYIRGKADQIKPSLLPPPNIAGPRPLHSPRILQLAIPAATNTCGISTTHGAAHPQCGSPHTAARRTAGRQRMRCEAVVVPEQCTRCQNVEGWIRDMGYESARVGRQGNSRKTHVTAAVGGRARPAHSHALLCDVA
jgi:hypothetical protein